MVHQELVRDFVAIGNEGRLLDELLAHRAERLAIETIVEVFPGTRTIGVHVDADGDRAPGSVPEPTYEFARAVTVP